MYIIYHRFIDRFNAQYMCNYTQDFEHNYDEDDSKAAISGDKGDNDTYEHYKDGGDWIDHEGTYDDDDDDDDNDDGYTPIFCGV